MLDKLGAIAAGDRDTKNEVKEVPFHRGGKVTGQVRKTHGGGKNFAST